MAKRLSLICHRWLGITLGFYFLCMGLSGAYLATVDRIERWTEPNLVCASGEASALNLDQWVQAAKLGLQTDRDPTRIDWALRRTVQLRFSLERAGKTQQVRAYVDPVTHQFLGARNWNETLRAKIFSFHHDLLAGRTGRVFVMLAGVLLSVILLSGLVLWWPSGSVRSALPLRRQRSQREFHRFFGFYSSLLLGVSVVTGVILSYPAKPSKAHPRPHANWAHVQTQVSRHLIEPQPFKLKLKDQAVEVTAARQALRLNLATGETDPAWRPGRLREVSYFLHRAWYLKSSGDFLLLFVGALPLFFWVTGLTIWRRKAQTTGKLNTL